jgi:hypothetical protein
MRIARMMIVNSPRMVLIAAFAILISAVPTPAQVVSEQAPFTVHRVNLQRWKYGTVNPYASSWQQDRTRRPCSGCA